MESKGMKLIKKVKELEEREEVNTFTMSDVAIKELQELLGINEINSVLGLSFMRDGIVRELCDIKDTIEDRSNELFDNVLITMSTVTAVIDSKLIEIGAEV